MLPKSTKSALQDELSFKIVLLRMFYLLRCIHPRCQVATTLSLLKYVNIPHVALKNQIKMLITALGCYAYVVV